MSDNHSEATRKVGAPVDRVDGRLKVTGAATYSAEFAIEGLHHAVIVNSTAANARLLDVDTSVAEGMPGVVKVLTHRNVPKLPAQVGKPPASRVLTLLQDDVVHYNGQPIAVVVADTLERATDAAHRVTATYDAREPLTDIAHAGRTEYRPSEASKEPDCSTGDVSAGLAHAEERISPEYTTPIENHNPIEPHATIAVWEGDRLTVYDATQYVVGVRNTIAKTFDLPRENVRVVSRFIGGGFGTKGSTWSHVPLAVLAAREAGVPVKLVLTRRQMFGSTGARAQTEQRVTLGARRDGTLTAIRHESVSYTSRYEDYLEPAAAITRNLYACPNIETTHRLVQLDLGTPTFQRAPGEATGSFALECALDEMAERLGMDPLELRLKNYAERDPESGKPFSSKSLRECYRDAAERFGWARRNRTPGAMRDGDIAIGHGMATATYPTNRSKAAASVTLTSDGHGGIDAVVQTASQDIGTGTYTVMTQLAAEALGIPVDRVRMELGDSQLPPSPVSGGSQTAASTGSAVDAVCREACARMAADGASDLASMAAWLDRQPGRTLSVRSESKPGKSDDDYSKHAFGAVFVEVHVDRALGEIRVPRIVGTYAAGRILNAKTARNQLIGGVVWGVGMALEEKTLVDPRTARYMNANLEEYHVPVNADIGHLDLRFIDEEDTHVNPIGVKGIGEIGITGVPAAIASAVYNATRLRVRDLPITLDKLIMGGTA
jgi:xanthine dehydrogenase YagR molybdenum-binding subunit